ncbi:hypothetical protein QKW35_14620 [Pontibacterium granulatum]|uniref:hypothetical protein n=1 Tax=Pontibacterium granulatum TaxID=2036029 RepID=UPI00249CBAC6|nr:hypothetical protein [Pontibacterium granulatum]MDI3325609.1 hypothetical protein [Pontibacterium granulatum]
MLSALPTALSDFYRVCFFIGIVFLFGGSLGLSKIIDDKRSERHWYAEKVVSVSSEEEHQVYKTIYEANMSELLQAEVLLLVPGGMGTLFTTLGVLYWIFRLQPLERKTRELRYLQVEAELIERKQKKRELE